MSLDQGGAPLNAVGGGHAIGEFRECLGKDTLTAIDIHDALIVSKVRRCRSDRLLRNTQGHCLMFEVGEPFIVRTPGAAWHGTRRIAQARGNEQYRR